MTDLSKIKNSDSWDYLLPYTVLQRLGCVVDVFNNYGMDISVPDYESLFDGYNTKWENSGNIVNTVEKSIDIIHDGIDFLFPEYDRAVTWDIVMPQTNGLNRWIDIVNALMHIAEFNAPAPIGLKYDDDTVIKYDGDSVIYYPQILSERI